MALEQVVLSDPATGSQAKVLVGFGFNCYSFETVHNGQRQESLWSTPDFESGAARPSSSGIPLLFPFPGRIGGAALEWDGQPYSLADGDGRGNAIHGFVLGRPWRIVDQSETHVVGEFQASVDDTSLLKQWPADFLIRARYELSANCLHSVYTFHNPDDKPLPCGFGTHPYFRVPLGGKAGDACTVRFPVSEKWQLQNMLPTSKHPLDEPAESQNGVRFSDMQFDDVFQGLEFSDGICTTGIDDPNSGRKLTMSFDDTFNTCVVYNPPHREAVCIEPYTCVPDPIRLTSEGYDVGLRVLQPDESFTARVSITVE